MPSGAGVCAGEAVALEPHVPPGCELCVAALGGGQGDLHDMGEEKEHASVHPSAQANGGQHTQPGPPHNIENVKFELRSGGGTPDL